MHPSCWDGTRQEAAASEQKTTVEENGQFKVIIIKQVKHKTTAHDVMI